MKFALKKYSLSILTLLVLGIFSGLEAKIPDKPHGDLPSDYWQFWFLYESEKRSGQDYRIIRPFYSIYTEHETAYKQQTVLFPLYFKEETNYWSTWTVFFFFTGTTLLHEDTGQDEDTLTPLFFWGAGDNETERYWGFFPLYGTLKGKLSYQEVNFVLFPIYSSWSRNNYQARSILWPFVMWGGSDVRDDIRILPFYSKKEHKDKYYQYTVLWPFFQWGRKFMDKREPVSYGMIFPFYLYKDSDDGNMKSRGFLWFPLIGSMVGYGYDKRNAETDFNILYFLLQYGKSNDNDYRKLIFFPFYGQYQFASKKTLFITPFYFNLSSDTYHVKSNYNFFFPFFSHMVQYYPELDRSDRYWKIWPLLKFHRDTEGSLEWNAFTLFPMRSEELEKTWDPIISLLEYKNLSNGEKRFSILFRLYSQRWSEDQFSLYIPLLTDYESKGENMEWKFLYGLIGVKKEDDIRSYKFLWFIQI